jgi:hypothetical protein
MILMVSNDGCTGCVYPGVDVNAKTVEVLPTDLAARDEWISIMAEGKETDPFHGQDRHGLSKPSMDGHEFYVSRLKQCGVAPWKFKIDVAVVKVWRNGPDVSRP